MVDTLIDRMLDNHVERTEWLRVMFNYLFIKNSSLKACYPGGVIGFSALYYSFFNDHISTVVKMGPYFDGLEKELAELGMTEGIDFIIGNDFYCITESESRMDLDLGVDWLEAWFNTNGIYVKYRGK